MRGAFVLILALLPAACNRTPDPEPAPAPGPAASLAPEAAAEEAAEPEDASPELAVDEPLPPFDEIGSIPIVVAQGEFAGDAEQPASGRYRIYQIPDSRLLRIEELKVTGSGDLDVVLLARVDALDGMAVISDLKGVSGNQNYLMDVRLNLARYQSLAVVSRQQNLILARAPLGRP